MAHALDAAVSALMRVVGREVVMARFRSLAAADIEEKAPGDLVTIADRESEARLTEGLGKLLPEARVIGEEACAADPGLLDDIGRGVAWIVDPIDGTGNYAAGRPPFAVMVGLLAHGEVQAGWILDPMTGRMCHAALGGGAFIDGDRVVARGSQAALPIAALATQYLPQDYRVRIEARAVGRLTTVGIPRCAGEQYPRLLLGQNDAALFWRALPWDHAAGALLLTEAGGRIARLDGAPYRIGIPGEGLLAAATPALWEETGRILAG